MNHSPRFTQSLQISSMSQILQTEQNNDNNESNNHIQPSLKDKFYNFSSSSDSTWTNTVDNAKSEISTNDRVSIGTNTLGTSERITRIKRSSSNMYSAGLSPR
jgi:hypothetical protein